VRDVRAVFAESDLLNFNELVMLKWWTFGATSGTGKHLLRFRAHVSCFHHVPSALMERSDDRTTEHAAAVAAFPLACHASTCVLLSSRKPTVWERRKGL